MDYKKFLFLTFLLFIFGCNDYPFDILNKSKKTNKTIEIGNISEQYTIPNRFISEEFRKNIEKYISKNTKLNLVLQNGDILIEGKFLNYKIIPISSSRNKIIIIVEISLKEVLNSNKNWKGVFIISKIYMKNKKNFSSDPIDDLINILTKKVYERLYLDFL